MTTKEFTAIAPKLSELQLVRTATKGERCSHALGLTCIGGTERQNAIIWRKYGTLQNILINKKSDEVNKALWLAGLNAFFTAKPTKSGEMCRLVTVNY